MASSSKRSSKPGSRSSSQKRSKKKSSPANTPAALRKRQNDAALQHPSEKLQNAYVSPSRLTRRSGSNSVNLVSSPVSAVLTSSHPVATPNISHLPPDVAAVTDLSSSTIATPRSVDADSARVVEPPQLAFEYEFNGPLGALLTMLLLPVVCYTLIFACTKDGCEISNM
jgi:hypothetical protein